MVYDGPETQKVASPIHEALGERYTIEGELGEGGMATMYLAEDVKLQRKIAINGCASGVSSFLYPLEGFLK